MPPPELLSNNGIMNKSREKRNEAAVWQRRFWATGRCYCHPLSANAAPTPCTDGENIFAFFSSNDLTDILDKTLELASADYDLKKQYDFREILNW